MRRETISHGHVHRWAGIGLASAVIAGMLMPAAPAFAATKYAVSASASRSQVSVGQSVTFSGRVSPAAPGKTIHVQEYVSRKWKALADRTLDSNSRFVLSARPSTAGPHTYRFLKDADKSYAAADARILVKAFRWRYLSDMQAVDYSSYNWVSGPSQVNGQTYAHSAHVDVWQGSYDWVEYNLARACTILQTTIGIDDNSPGSTHGVMEIFSEPDHTALVSHEFALGQSQFVDLRPSSVLRIRLSLTDTSGQQNLTGTYAFGNAQIYCSA